MPVASICRICAEAALEPPFAVQERMQGTQVPFDYRRCAACGSLSIGTLPDAETLRRAYGPGYYAHGAGSRRGWRASLAALRDRAALLPRGGGPAGLAGQLLTRLKPEPVIGVLAWAGLKPGMRILDVGCGRGVLLERLARAGLRDLAGADPFMPEGSRTPSGIPIAAQSVEELDPACGPFDVVMFHHALEHVPDPAAALTAAARLLAPGGLCLVRVPTPDSEAFARYGPLWVQLDAPRHVSLPGRTGMKRLAARAGLELARCRDDSTGFQFWGSELYARGIALSPPDAPPTRPQDHFTPAQLRGWEAEAEALNAQGRGDQVAFVLRRA